MLQGKQYKNRIKLSLRILRNLPDKKRYLFPPILLMTFSSIISLLIPLMAMKMLDYFKQQNDLVWENIIFTGLCWLAALVFVGFIEYKQKLLFRKYANLILEGMHNSVLEKIYSQSNDKWWSVNSKELSDEVSRDMDELYPFYAGGIFDLLRNILVIILSSIILILLNYKLTLTLMLLVPLYLAVHLFWHEKIKQAYFISREASQKYLSSIVELLQTIPLINVYNSFNYESLRVGRQFNELLNKRYLYFAKSNKKIVLSRTLSSAAPIYLLFCFFFFIHFGWSTVSEIIGFWGIFSLLLSSINSITGQSLNIINSIEIFNKIFGSGKNKPRLYFTKPEKFENLSVIDLKGIRLSFNGGSKFLVYPDFNIQKGEWIEIRGRSGIGKTSLIKCLLGQITPTGGFVEVNGYNLRDIDQNDYLRHIGYVEQNGYIYSRTLKENILLNRNYEPDLFNKIITLARLENILGTKPERENSLVGENGIQLSGGEKQRIIIARALYHQPEWLIFDEPFSGLDNTNIEELLNILQSLRNNYTAIVVSHRELDMIKFDKVIKLN